MFIFKLTYKKPLEDVEKYLGAHREYLDKFYQAGNFIASGPREPRVGGVILCNAKSIENAKEIIAQDPFYIYEIADYEITWFHATKHNSENFNAALE
ncbi:MAG: GTP cyclohydrolase [Bacteroidales bacterium]|nr:GTP cyclohydrolase [Bacteroidales bacterium]